MFSGSQRSSSSSDINLGKVRSVLDRNEAYVNRGDVGGGRRTHTGDPLGVSGTEVRDTVLTFGGGMLDSSARGMPMQSPSLQALGRTRDKSASMITSKSSNMSAAGAISAKHQSRALLEWVIIIGAFDRMDGG